MRHVRRGAVIAAMSLALFGGVAALWARSHWRADMAALFVGAAQFQAIASHRGGVLLCAGEVRRRTPGIALAVDHTDAATFNDARGVLRDVAPTTRRLMGFEFAHLPRAGGGGGAAGTTFTLTVVPHWFLAVLTLLLPASRLRGRRRRLARLRGGRCPNCGYDTRATPGRCPECGTDQPVVAAPAAATA